MRKEKMQNNKNRRYFNYLIYTKIRNKKLSLHVINRHLIASYFNFNFNFLAFFLTNRIGLIIHQSQIYMWTFFVVFFSSVILFLLYYILFCCYAEMMSLLNRWFFRARFSGFFIFFLNSILRLLISKEREKRGRKKLYMYIILFPALCCNTIEILLSKVCLTERNCNCNRNRYVMKCMYIT
jgi:hypothetical protein